MFGIGAQELLLLLLIVLVLFGSAKLPALAKSIGQSIRELKKGLTEDPGNEKPKTDKEKEAQ
jgi:sec-independent protein translocase protein TatA